MGCLPTSARKHLTADYARSGCGRSILGPGFNSRRLHFKEVECSPAASSKWAPLLHLAFSASSRAATIICDDAPRLTGRWTAEIPMRAPMRLVSKSYRPTHAAVAAFAGR